MNLSEQLQNFSGLIKETGCDTLESMDVSRFGVKLKLVCIKYPFWSPCFSFHK